MQITPDLIILLCAMTGVSLVVVALLILRSEKKSPLTPGSIHEFVAESSSPMGNTTKARRRAVEVQLNAHAQCPFRELPILVDPASEKFMPNGASPIHAKVRAEVVGLKTGKLVGWVEYELFPDEFGITVWDATPREALLEEDPGEYAVRMDRHYVRNHKERKARNGGMES